MTGKITRHSQADFEQSLKHALLNKDLINQITEILIGSVIEKLKEKFQYYENKINSLEKELAELKSFTEENEIKNPNDSSQKILQEKVDNIQQQAKRNNIRLMCVPEDRGEQLNYKVMKLFKEKLNMDIKPHDILATYRVGSSKNDRPRHIVVNLRENSVKMNIYKNKKLLKGTGFVMKEDLTPSRLLAFQKASERYGFKNVWTVNGTIFVKNNSGVQKILPNSTDL